MKCTLIEWLQQSELHLAEDVDSHLHQIGTVVSCDDSATDWEYWMGAGIVVETNPTGTRVVRDAAYTVSTKTGYYDLRDVSGIRADGLTPSEVADYVNGLNWPVYCTRNP